MMILVLQDIDVILIINVLITLNTKEMAKKKVEPVKKVNINSKNNYSMNLIGIELFI